ncbi:MAG TPA: hypothetical protein VNQ56_04595 [Pseudolabrys sp.]|nr:hypothetical protein [Pseudolabrys sp.]
MIDRLADPSSPDRAVADRDPAVHCAAARSGQMDADVAPADSGAKVASESEETNLLTRALGALAEHMMSHVRAQMPDAPARDRICPDKSLPV